MIKRVMSGFLVEFFGHAVPKNFEGETFCDVFWKVSGSEEVFG